MRGSDRRLSFHQRDLPTPVIGRQIIYNEREGKEIIILSGGSTYYPTPVVGTQITYKEGK